MIERFDSLVENYTGGTSDRSEVADYRAEVRAVSNLFPLFSETKSSVNIATNSPIPTMLIHESPFVMPGVLQALLTPTPFMKIRMADLYPEGTTEKWIQLQLARMEYFLWKSSTELTVEQWMKETLQVDVDPNSKTILFIKETFGADSMTYRKFMQTK